MSEPSAVCQWLVHFSGRVQGVGFRYTTVRIAQRFRVSGYVQNLSDGRVRLVTQGDVAEIEAFVGAVRDELSRYITNVAVEDSAAAERFADFSVRN